MKLEFLQPEEIEPICQKIDEDTDASINMRIERSRKKINKDKENFENEKEKLIGQIRRALYLKFVVVKKKEGVEEEVLIKLFNHTHTHYQQFDENTEDFIGAGKLNSGEIYWDSESFGKKLGRDRPEKDADQILAEVREKIEQWIEDLVDTKLNISSTNLRISV